MIQVQNKQAHARTQQQVVCVERSIRSESKLSSCRAMGDNSTLPVNLGEAIELVSKTRN